MKEISEMASKKESEEKKLKNLYMKALLVKEKRKVEENSFTKRLMITMKGKFLMALLMAMDSINGIISILTLELLRMD